MVAEHEAVLVILVADFNESFAESVAHLEALAAKPSWLVAKKSVGALPDLTVAFDTTLPLLKQSALPLASGLKHA
jgi:hypothetical protein